MATEKSKNATYPLRKQLQQKAREVLQSAGMPSHLAKLGAYDLYQAFLGTSPDMKGWLTMDLNLGEKLKMITSKPLLSIAANHAKTYRLIYVLSNIMKC